MRILDINSGPGLQQQGDHPRRLRLRCKMQRCPAVVVSGAWIEAKGKEFACGFGPVIARGIVQRRTSVLVNSRSCLPLWMLSGQVTPFGEVRNGDCRSEMVRPQSG